MCPRHLGPTSSFMLHRSGHRPTLLGCTARLRFSIHLSLSAADRQEKHLLPDDVVTCQTRWCWRRRDHTQAGQLREARGHHDCIAAREEARRSCQKCHEAQRAHWTLWCPSRSAVGKSRGFCHGLGPASSPGRQKGCLPESERTRAQAVSQGGPQVPRRSARVRFVLNGLLLGFPSLHQE